MVYSVSRGIVPQFIIKVNAERLGRGPVPMPMTVQILTQLRLCELGDLEVMVESHSHPS